MYKIFLSFFISFIVIISSCNYYSGKKVIKPNSSGKTGEIVVVLSDNLWNSQIGDTIFYSLSEPYGVLPQDEATFSVVHIPPDAFKNIFKNHRNLIIINIGAKFPQADFTVEQDKWANSQLVYTFYAPDTSSFVNLWNELDLQIVLDFFDTEINRYQEAYKKYKNDIISKSIAKNFNISMNIPSEYFLDVEEDNFCWISRETQISSQGIIIYSYPYTDTNTFTTEYIVNKRDEIAKEKIPGPIDGSYMQTEKRIPMQDRIMLLNDNYAFMLKGLWYTENYFMGGPFISISILDKKRNKVICVDAYVYAGKQEKKLYMWQLESILKTLKILD